MESLIDTLFALGNRGKSPTAELFPGKRTKKVFYQIQPRRTGRSKEKKDSFLTFNPFQYLCMLVGAIIVQDDVDLLIFRHR